MAKLAFMTIGLLQAPDYDPWVQGFIDRIDANFTAADSSAGFLDRSTRDAISGEHLWGTAPVPRIFQGRDTEDRLPKTLSLWQDLESVYAFAYNGAHAEALSKRKEWFVKPEWPTYVAWWVPDDHTPSWPEAIERYDFLCQAGSSSVAFDFRQPFDASGQPVKLDREVVKTKALVNKGEG